jgi:drug/metabolite transporter superfamily protein YnfA
VRTIEPETRSPGLASLRRGAHALTLASAVAAFVSAAVFVVDATQRPSVSRGSLYATAGMMVATGLTMVEMAIHVRSGDVDKAGPLIVLIAFDVAVVALAVWLVSY